MIHLQTDTFTYIHFHHTLTWTYTYIQIHTLAYTYTQIHDTLIQVCVCVIWLEVSWSLSWAGGVRRIQTLIYTCMHMMQIHSFLSVRFDQRWLSLRAGGELEMGKRYKHCLCLFTFSLLPFSTSYSKFWVTSLFLLHWPLFPPTHSNSPPTHFCVFTLL
jgi:hypothetical protein